MDREPRRTPPYLLIILAGNCLCGVCLAHVARILLVALCPPVECVAERLRELVWVEVRVVCQDGHEVPADQHPAPFSED